MAKFGQLHRVKHFLLRFESIPLRAKGKKPAALWDLRRAKAPADSAARV